MNRRLVGAYQHAAPLPNPTRDAKAITEMFQTAGFDTVLLRNDVGNLDFKRALRDFFAVARGADIAVVFFAGHGIQIADQNYLIPVDARLAQDYDATDEAISLERIIEAIEPAARLRLVVVRSLALGAPEGSRLAEEGVDQGRLAVVDVGDDRHVAQVVAGGHAEGHLRSSGKPLRRHAASRSTAAGPATFPC